MQDRPATHRRIATASFALGLLVGPALPAGAGDAPPAAELRFSAGTFRPHDEPGPAPDWFRAAPLERGPRGHRYLVAIARRSLAPGERAALEEAGAEVLGYVPVHGYRLRLLPDAEPAIRALPFVRWLGPTPPQLKVLGDLAARAEQDRGADVPLRAVLFGGEPVDRVRAVLDGLVVTAAPAGKDGAWRVVAHVPSNRLAGVVSGLASLPEVEAVEPARRVRALNQDAVWVHQSFVGPSPQQTPVFDHGIFGCGQVVAVADTGQDYGSCYFRDTVLGAPPISNCVAAPCPPDAPNLAQRKDVLYYNWSGTPAGDDAVCSLLGGGHGTHTSGSVAGDNAPYANCTTYSTPGRNGGDGEAPGAKLVFQELGDGLEYLNSFGGTVWNLADVAHQSGARLLSGSWGGSCEDLLGQCVPGCTLPYDSLARDADLAMWTYPELLLVFAAGNSVGCAPPDSVTTPATGKNLLSVGSVGHGAGANVPSSASSTGPVFDGRLKPTVAAQGESTVSAASDGSPATANCGSCSLSGTSMAAPTAAGLAALAREYYTAGFYPGGVRDPGQGFAPSGALVKATLIDGAVALGAGAPEPDYDAGHGRILLGSTLAFADSAHRLRVDDHREGIATGSVVTHAYDVAGTTPFRATLVWTDPPAALDAAVARVNELKLEVVDPAGQVWFQTRDRGTGLPAGTASPSDPHDDVNVEERLVFESPAAGRWVVRVVGVDVPWGPQPFALVVRGDLADCPAPAAPGAPVLATPAEHQVELSWAGVGGAASYNVYRSLGACPGGPWVPVVSAATGTTFLDTGLSGGAAYSYRITAASDPGGHCESAPSSCISVVPTGECTLAPDFPGVASAVSAGLGDCTVELAWEPAVPYCGGDARYNVYRSTVAGFVPGPENRIARCLPSTGYTDSVDLASGVPQHYVVRAEDATEGHGGPCRGGNEDGNAATATVLPDGPPGFGSWSDDAGDSGPAKLVAAPPWTNPASGGHLGPRVYRVTSSAGACADLTTPALTLADPGQAPQLEFFTRHDLEFDPFGIFGAEGSIGQVEIANGPAFADWTRLPLSPDYPEWVDFTLINCTSTLDGMTYFASSHPAWTQYSASLVNWGGGEVKIRFHLSGDFFYPSGDWWIDEVSVTGTFVPGTCATLPAGPPPIPDGGAVPGQPLRASRAGDDVLLTWDAASCPATAVNVYYGTIGDYTTFTGGECGLPATGSATVAIPDGSWFLVAATDGGSTDGSWARDLDGAERTYAGATAACPAIADHVTNNGCP